MRVRFVGNSLINELEAPVISTEELIYECLKNVEYSYRVIEIIKYTLSNLGYDLECKSFQYRNSSLFNTLEHIIVHSEAYQKNKNKKHAKNVKVKNEIVTEYIQTFHAEIRQRQAKEYLVRQRYKRNRVW